MHGGADLGDRVTNYRLYVNAARTILIRFWDNGEVEVCTRESGDHIWGPPVRMVEEESK